MRKLALTLAAVVAVASTQAAFAQTRIQPQPVNPTPVPMLQKQAPKPDLVILHASAIGGKNDQFMVQVKNAGAADSPATQLLGTNTHVHRNSRAVVPVPPIKAGQFVWVKVELPKASQDDDQMSARIDHKNAVAESNENNNFHLFHW